MAEKEARPMRLQERDVRLMATIGEIGLLDASTINEFFFPAAKGPRACQDRLSLLVEHGYLKDHRLAKPYRVETTGSGQATTTKRVPPRRLPTIYQLRAKGVRLVTEKTGQSPTRPGRSAEPSELFLMHRLGVARSRLILDEAFRRGNLPCPEWIHEEDTYPNAQVGDRHADRLVLHETFRSPTGQAIPCRPDAEAKIEVPGIDKTLIVSLEYDRDTMDVKDVEAKLAGYQQLWETKAYLKRWPMLGKHLVRLFFICPDERRVRHLSDRFDGHAIAKAIRFTWMSELTPETALHGEIWRSTAGKMHRIIPPPTST